MISVELQNIGKKFGREWIFRGINYRIEPAQKLVILGGNGSGKSTLLQVISGFVSPNEGKLLYHLQQQNDTRNIQEEELLRYISFASPYLQLIEEFTMLEMVEHAAAFKPLMKDLKARDLIQLTGLDASAHKPLKQFSSGMKQRVKLALAVLSEAPLLLLDEPVSNLDKQGIEWYQQLVTDYGKEKTVIVCSNAIAEEYAFCTTQLQVGDYKLVKP